MARKKQAKTNITAYHKAAFEALISGEYDNFCVVSCFVNGEPTSAIATVNTVTDANGTYLQIEPVFVAITPAMVLTDHDGRVA